MAPLHLGPSHWGAALLVRPGILLLPAPDAKRVEALVCFAVDAPCAEASIEASECAVTRENGRKEAAGGPAASTAKRNGLAVSFALSLLNAQAAAFFAYAKVDRSMMAFRAPDADSPMRARL